ncbi:SusC/RagA family TonB-linked outer membrane protein [Plebeiibacterium sediminum]|nr:TonB-dependent receptor [Plebeiobacterium sediminum]
MSKLLLFIGLIFSFSFCEITAKANEKASITEQSEQQISISGIVKDSSGEPLIGVSIQIKGTTNGTITDIDGKFSMTCNENDILLFSYIGFNNLEVRAGDNAFHDIVLETDSEAIDEVVVIGYGTTTKKHVIGAVDKVGEKMMKDRPVASVSQALQGMSPSLTIQQRSMNPNDNSMNINIRGISSMNNNDPLIVIDGMISNDVQAMNKINPNDIENVSILKDAGTAAIYGSRAANGVILITTKKGKKGMKQVISFNSSIGTQNPEILIQPVKGYQNALLRNDSYVNAGLQPIYSPSQIAEFAKGDSEWGYEAIMKNALQQNYNINVQGGSSTTTYNVSFGYYDQESNYKGQDFGIGRYNLRSNIVTEISKLKLTTLLSYDRQEGRSDRGGLWLSDAMRVPNYMMYDLYPDADGKYYNNAITTNGNMLASLYHGGLTTTDNDHFQGIVSGELELISGLKAKAVIGYDLNTDHRFINRKWYPVYDYINRNDVVNQADDKEFHQEDYNSKSTMLNTQFLLNYDKTLGAHHISGLVGYTTESYRRKANEIKRFYVDPDLGLDTDETIYDTGSYNSPQATTERALHSYLGRLSYSYMDTYYLEASARYDGSSKFAKDNRWGFFPSGTVGWRISEESFFNFYKDKIGDLKLRASYGLLGSQSVNDYQFLTTYDIYNNQYGFNNSSVTGTGYTYGNELLSWEKTRTLNLGFDAICSNNLQVTFDFFNKNTTDILLTPQTPSTLGGAVPRANIGEMRNRGWELTLSYNLKHSGFAHFFSFNIGDSYNEVVKYGDQSIAASDEIERLIREGVPYYSYYGYKTDGLYKNQDEIRNSATFIGANLQPGDVKYVDRNEDGVIDDNDRYILGNAFPRYNYGFTYNATWKGFDFNMLWQGVGKRDMALRGEMIEPFHGSYYYVMFEHQLDYWTPNNTDAKYPRLINNAASSSYTNNYGHGSDRNLYNAAYLRLKNVQLGYTLPKRLVQKVGMQKFRLYVTGQNLLTFTKNKFIDPESTEFGNSMNASGANSGRNYPTLKYYGGGIDIEF